MPYRVLIKYHITWTTGKHEERVINAFETWCWRRILKIKWTDETTNDEGF
jgi:hypothetical protein